MIFLGKKINESAGVDVVAQDGLIDRGSQAGDRQVEHDLDAGRQLQHPLPIGDVGPGRRAGLEPGRA